MSPSTIVALFVAVALLGIAAVMWQRAFVLALPFLVLLNGLSIPFGGRAVHLDQIVACVLVVPLAASILVGTRTLRMDSTARWLGTILVLNIVASALHSPARGYSLLQCANLASVWMIYGLLLNMLDSSEVLERFLRHAIWAAIAGSGIAIGAYALAVVGVRVGGAEVSSSAAVRLTSAYGAYGTMVEPNILGSFAAAYLVLGVGLLLGHNRLRGRRVDARALRWSVGLTAVALVLSFTRAAWVAAVVGLASLVFVGTRVATFRVRGRQVVAPLIGVALLVAGLLFLPGQAAALFRFKLANLVNLESQTAVVRLISYALALQQTAEHWVTGWGTFTFAPLAAQGADFQQFDNWRNLWIGNYLLLALHDTGAIGLALWVGLIGSILRRAARVRREVGMSDLAAANTTVALAAAAGTLLVAFLSTSGFSLGYSWLLIGMLGAYCRVALDGSARPVAPPTPAVPIAVEEDCAVPAGAVLT